ncbi:hypothetical protein RM530_00990 [Algiphilus sp. W345]|uniref:DUF2628 domain-containing protein n=1 Tax=Banduia mediterranea TaxID=3075609 RepID=A0ABU2WFS3_9GAMM|nr:hypothetical protein [Algiphilus sp. W345]MDT0495942.1 hypothetical protein [Algiphilus sp. W345]
MLSPVHHFQKLAAAGLRPEVPQLFALDHAETLAHRHRSVQAVREPIKRQFGERFYRMWPYSLAFTTFWLWAAYKLRTWSARIAWLLAIYLAGNMAMAVFVLWQVWTLPRDAGLDALLTRRA